MATNVDLWGILSDLKKCKWVDLTHAFGPDTPRFPAFDPAKNEVIYSIEEHGFLANKFTFPGQYGTHMDAPGHFTKGGRMLHEIELKEMVLPLVVIDCSEEAKKDNNYELTVQDIFDWESEYGTVPEGSFVAMRTDWCKRWPSQEKCMDLDSDGNQQGPGWSLEALKFLYEVRKINANGHEPFDTDSQAMAIKNKGLIAEGYVLGQDKLQIEVMTNLDQVPPTGAIIFCIVPKPLNASGFPVRAFAIVNN